MKLIKDLGMVYPKETSKKKYRYGIYECPVCLKHFRTSTDHVKAGKSTKCQSCASSKHGLYKHRLYSIYSNMKSRCYNKNNNRYKYYGGNGITICNEWLNDFMSFYNWALENGYNDSLEIDRIDNDENYTPNNCRWANRTIQNINTRQLRSTNTSGYRGITYAKNCRKWHARIQQYNKVIFSFQSKCLLVAVLERDKEIIKHNLSHKTSILQKDIIDSKNKIGIYYEKRNNR